MTKILVLKIDSSLGIHFLVVCSKYDKSDYVKKYSRVSIKVVDLLLVNVIQEFDLDYDDLLDEGL